MTATNEFRLEILIMLLVLGGIAVLVLIVNSAHSGETGDAMATETAEASTYHDDEPLPDTSPPLPDPRDPIDVVLDDELFAGVAQARASTNGSATAPNTGLRFHLIEDEIEVNQGYVQDREKRYLLVADLSRYRVESRTTHRPPSPRDDEPCVHASFEGAGIVEMLAMLIAADAVAPAPSWAAAAAQRLRADPDDLVWHPFTATQSGRAVCARWTKRKDAEFVVYAICQTETDPVSPIPDTGRLVATSYLFVGQEGVTLLRGLAKALQPAESSP